MSTIEKLSIQGIRSFGHEERDKQVLEFFKPLTLIVGHNGAGKTTIIECLRYVCSGDQPPGSKSSFVHDPKVAHETEVKAQVKLKFKDKVGENVIVTRNLMATQKAKRTEFKSLEGTIRRVDQLGAAKSLSSKCAEIDREMVESLGVSKPVLVNVIFCHQEEANWPLSEGKQLKNKFDEIFAATRYIKAVDNIKKIRQDQQGSIRELNVESRYLKDDKDKAKQLSETLDNQKIRLSAAKESVSKIDAQMAPLQDKLEDIENRELEVQKLDKEIAKLKAGREQMLMTCREIEEGLQSVFEGSLDELKKMYKDHQKETEKKQKTLEEREREYSRSMRTLAKLRDDKSKLLTLYGKLEQEAEYHEKLKIKQKDCVKQMAEIMNIPGYHGMAELTSKQLTNFRKEVDTKKKGLLEELHQVKQSYEKKERDFDQQSQGLRDTKSKLEQSISMKTNQIKDNRQDIQLISEELNNMEDNAHRIRDLEDELRKANLELEKAVKSVNIEELRKEIEQMKANKKQKDGQLSELRKEMSKLSKQSEILTRLEMWEKEKRKKEDNIRKIRNKHEEEMAHLLGRFPSANARNQLEDFIVGKKREVSQSQEQLQRAKMQKSTEESNQKHILYQLKEKETELREIEEKLMVECGSQDIGKSLHSLQQSINNLQSERGALTGSTHLYERYIRSLERTEAQCPLCHRGFDTEDEVQELVQELRDKLRLAPAKMKEKEKSLNQQREKLSKLQKMEPLKEKMTKLSEEEIPDLKTRLAAVTEKLNKLNSKIEEEEDSLTMLQGDETMAVNMKPDIIMLDQNLAEVKNLEQQIGTLQQRISSDGRMRTSEEVNKEYGDLELELETLNSSLERKQRQRDDYSENVEMLRANINSLSTEKLRLSEQLQQQDKLESRKTELATSNKQLQKDVEDSKKEIKPIESKLKELESKKKELLMKKEDALVTLQEEVNSISENLQEVERFTQEINRYISSGKAEELQANKSKIEDLKDELSKEEREESSLKQSIDQLKEDIVGEEVKERELYDNIQLNKKRSEVEDVNQKLKSFEDQRGSMDSTGLVREKHRLNNKLSTLFKEKNQADGRQSVLKEEVKKLESELKSEKYRTAEEKYTEVMIKLKTLEVANKDLDKYSKALDTAIMKYHKLKMEEINKIIKEYWRMTYKGNDIDYIEIRSEADTSTASSTRKSYNYRVVMVKGDTEMDMRGRCSAGQKVLASLIIRLALAETFCLSCGILALDEPTTNLDRENIEGLAHALVDIIKSRESRGSSESQEKQKNFQLIVITHDEDFVELLGRSDYADHFYRVTKNNEAKSVIYKKPMEALA